MDENLNGQLFFLDVDECLGLPCANDAFCVNVPGSYFCYCKEGYTGKTCGEVVEGIYDNNTSILS